MAEGEPRLTPESYQPPLSLWRLVEQYVPEGEREEVRSMLGYSLVELSLDLHREVDTMLEIWRECQSCHQDRLAQPGLPEPPAIRERLVQEICFFVQNVKDQARTKGMDADHIFSKHNSEVIDYALQTSRGGRPGSTSPSTMSRSESRASSRMSANLTDEVSSMRKQLNVGHFSEVTSHLREYLESEIKQLEEDVVLLQESVVEEQDEMDGFRPCSSLSREPTISELREERTSLEKEWLSQDKLPTSPPQTASGLSSRTKTSPPQEKPHVSHRQGSPVSSPPGVASTTLGGKAIPGSRLRPIQSETKSQSSRPTPLRASHTISTVRQGSPNTSSSSSSLEVSDSDSATKAGGDAPEPMSAGRPHARSNSSSSDTDYRVPVRRRTISPSRVKVVPLGSIVSPQPTEPSTFSPTPPPSGKPNRARPGSAQRFRNMVMDCREGQ